MTESRRRWIESETDWRRLWEQDAMIAESLEKSETMDEARGRLL